MTREETKKCISIMQAYVDGKEIEGCYIKDDEWSAVELPTWNLYEKQYRIKEEPKPFDWRGKNIQWVRYGTTDPWKVAWIDHNGIATSTFLATCCHGWDKVIADRNYEWSSDNKTWRKFE